MNQFLVQNDHNHMDYIHQLAFTQTSTDYFIENCVLFISPHHNSQSLID